MIKITLIVNPDVGTDIQGVKEDIAYYVERFSDIIEIDVREIETQQERLKL